MNSAEDLFSNYLRHNEVNKYLDSLAVLYPNLVTVSVCGCSYEGRPIKSVKISYDNINLENNKESCDTQKVVPSKSFTSQNTNTALKARKKVKSKKVKTKSTVLIDGGIHGREWITVATAVYCIHELIDNFDENRKILQRLDFIIVPIINVDGYEYSHTNDGIYSLVMYYPINFTQYKLWRKTSRPAKKSNSTIVIGTDCNRNFDHHWNESRTCKNTFPGEMPFSEPETILLKTIMCSEMSNCKFYLTLHSHAKAFMYPWGYTKKPPKNWRELHKLALVGQKAIKDKTGNVYRCGSVATITRRIAAGGSPDYAFGVVKIPYVMTMELTGGSFHPPPSDIIRIVQESWIGIRAMCVFIGKH